MSLEKLKKVAAKYGGKIEIDHDSKTDKCFQVIAPDNKQWISGNCINMCQPFFTYIKTGDGSKENAINYLIERLSEGLEDYSKEING